MKVLLTILISIISINLIAGTQAPKKTKTKAKRLLSKKWYRLNRIINKEVKTIKSIGKLGPKLTYRLMELYTEKLKLTQEKENQLFLNAFSGTQKIKEKSEYFKATKELYDYTHKIGKHLVLAYPNFIHKSNIFYTMALNCREYDSGKWTENYLLRSLHNAPKNSKNLYNIKTNLAELYYNEKKYSKAIQFYQEILKTAGNEWHSKHLYNASWSYLKLKRYPEAISHLLSAYQFSQKKKFLSVEDQVLNSIGLFYVYSGDINPGINFYIKNVKAPADYLIKMSNKAADKLGQKQAQMILVKALKNAKKAKLLEEELLIRTAMLDHYRTFKLFDDFYKNSLSIYTLNKTQKVPKDFILSSIEKIKSLVGYLQVRLSNNMRKENTEYNEKELNQTINFFKILAGLDQENTDEYRFFQGETYFSISKYKLASKRYILALKYSIKKLEAHKSRVKKSKKDDMAFDLTKLTALQEKIFNSLFATISEGNLPAKLSEKYTIFAYKNHLKLWPINEKSRQIYPKLFNIYLKNKRLDDSLTVLTQFSKNYKIDIVKQRLMLGSIIDIHIKKENTDKLAHWVTRMENGFLSFDKLYIAKATGILSSILFKKLQIIEDTGNLKDAKLGYLSLYKNPKYPKTIKAKSSFKLAVLLLAKGRRKSSFGWYKRSVKLQTDKEFKQNIKTIYAIQESYYKQQDFRRSIAVSKTVIDRMCTEKFPKKEELIRNIIHFSLLENNYKKLISNFDKSIGCSKNKNLKEELSINIITHLKNHRLYDNYFNFTNRVDTNEKLEKLINLNLTAIYWDESSRISSKYKDMALTMLKNNPSKATNNTVEKINKFNIWKTSSNEAHFSFSKLDKFDEEKFNKDLQNNLNILKVITDSAAPVIKDGLPQIILPVYDIIIKSYERIALAIESYTPKGVPDEFVAGFKGQMKGLANNLINQSKQYEDTAVSLIEKEKLLTYQNSLFTNSSRLYNKYKFRYPSSSYTATLDDTNGGRR